MICIKLTTGEEIIGQEDTVCDEYVSISDPIKIVYGYDVEGNYGLRMQRLMSYTTDELYTFKSEHIVLRAVPTVEISELYAGYLEKIAQAEKIVEEEVPLNKSLH